MHSFQGWVQKKRQNVQICTKLEKFHSQFGIGPKAVAALYNKLLEEESVFCLKDLLIALVGSTSMKAIQ